MFCACLGAHSDSVAAGDAEVVKIANDIYTTINFTDEFRNVSVTEVGVAGWAWWARSTHA